MVLQPAAPTLAKNLAESTSHFQLQCRKVPLVSETNRVRAVREMTKTTCDICKIRKTVMDCNGMCTECYTEGGWENTHGDYNHEDLLAKLAEVEASGAVALRLLARGGLVRNAKLMKSDELRIALRTAILDKASVSEAELAECWICHPELNEAQKTPKAKRRVLNPSTERKSRVGQVINVPLKAPGIIKAEVTKAKLGDDLLLNINTDITTHEVRLDVNSPKLVLVLVWDADGRYDYEKSVAVVDGKARKVRNVAEALRLAQA